MKLSALLLVSPILAINVKYYSKYLSVLREHASTMQIPGNIKSLISEVRTYTDDSFTTLLSPKVVGELETILSAHPGLTHYLTDIPHHTAASTADASVTSDAVSATADVSAASSDVESASEITSEDSSATSEAVPSFSVSEYSNAGNYKMASLGGLVGVAGLMLL